MDACASMYGFNDTPCHMLFSAAQYWETRQDMCGAQQGGVLHGCHGVPSV